MTSDSPKLNPSRPDPADAEAAAIRQHFCDFFSAMLPAAAPDAAGCIRRITGLAHPLGNFAVFGPQAAPDAIAELASPLADDGFPSAAILGGGEDAAQAAPLLSLGFFYAEPMCLMSVTRDQLAPTATPEGYRLVELTPEDDDRFCDAFAEGYGVPEPLARMFSPAAAARRGVDCRYFGLAPADAPSGPLAAVSACAPLNGRPGIYAVATRPAHRGKGLAAHLTAEPLRLAWKGGQTAPGLLQSSAMGEPVYRRIGFRAHGHMALYVRIPGSAGA